MTTSDSTDRPERVGFAVADLAAHLSVGVDAVAVVRHERVTWPDGSLGCPRPDRQYTQALVEGFRIELSAAGRTYWYHGGRSGMPFRCDDPRPPIAHGGADT